MTVVAALGTLVFAAPAFATAPLWTITSQVAPRNLPPGGSGRLILTVMNMGDETANQARTEPIAVTDRLPLGLRATSISAELGGSGTGSEPSELTCTLASVSCEDTGALVPYAQFQVIIEVSVEGVPAVPNEARVSGGGAALVSTRDPLSVSSEPAGFGVEALELMPTNEDGSPDTQAGSHPFQLTNTINFNLERSQEILNTVPPRESLEMFPAAMAKDVRVNLPAGLVGDPSAIPQCTDEQFGTEVENGRHELINLCPADTAIGVAAVTLNLGAQPGSKGNRPIVATIPLFNLTPNHGEPARFGFLAAGVPVILDTSVRTGSDYGVVIGSDNISQIFGNLSTRIAVWGVPGAESHDQSRGWNCIDNQTIGNGPCTSLGQRGLTPLLTLPTSCSSPSSEPLTTTMEADSWAEPSVWKTGEYRWQDANGRPLALDGCNRLSFEPSIAVAPDGQTASTPTGLTVGLHVPQALSLVAAGTAESTVRDTTVTLPAGVATDPSGADGLESCTEAQIALDGHGAPACPEAAKIGTLYIKSPLLPNPLEGAAYLATQNANPFGSLIAIYLVAEDPVSGVLVKLAGEVKLDPVTGQLVTTFRNTPQLPFEDLKLHFFGGSRAPLTTPAYCGSYTTTTSVAPWSGNAPATPSSTFQITTGPGGTRATCSHPLPFAPSLTAGSTNLQAAAFTPFTLTMSRSDGNQNLQGIQLHMPPGLLGRISAVKLCEEPQAQAGTCGPESLIGHTVVSVGAGDSPFTVTGGKVFITGPYHGAPYGLSIVNPAKAGPFDLGQVIVRAAIEVDPTTSALTVTSYPLPTILDGIPLQIKHVNVTIDRPGFTFNPTDCAPLGIGATLSSDEGSSATTPVPFQVTNCATLGFKPTFRVSTSGRTSRARGASLDVKLTYPKAPFGTQANIRAVKVNLPRQLPSRLTTLQKACPDSRFEANPGGCPSGSIVGIARASTPVLPGELTGPAIFVSHGGAKFPELIVVLQGEGVRVDLRGETFISKAGITSSTFRQVPDVPVGSFELYLPQGSNSALAANGDLCYSTVTTRVKRKVRGRIVYSTRQVKMRRSLIMPTAFTAQNGAVIRQPTKIAVTGCGAKKASKARRARAARGHHKNGNSTEGSR